MTLFWLQQIAISNVGTKMSNSPEADTPIALFLIATCVLHSLREWKWNEKPLRKSVPVFADRFLSKYESLLMCKQEKGREVRQKWPIKFAWEQGSAHNGGNKATIDNVDYPRFSSLLLLWGVVQFSLKFRVMFSYTSRVSVLVDSFHCFMVECRFGYTLW